MGPKGCSRQSMTKVRIVYRTDKTQMIVHKQVTQVTMHIAGHRPPQGQKSVFRSSEGVSLAGGGAGRAGQTGACEGTYCWAGGSKSSPGGISGCKAGAVGGPGMCGQSMACNARRNGKNSSGGRCSSVQVSYRVIRADGVGPNRVYANSDGKPASVASRTDRCPGPFGHREYNCPGVSPFLQPRNQEDSSRCTSDG